MMRHRTPLLFVVGALTLLGIVGYFVSADSMRQKLLDFNVWVASLGYLGPLVLATADAIAIVLCFPFTVGFELAAGFLFGTIPGCVLSIL